jgi:cellulose synthase/poly-beta-1,6-N-acetylglucosamine synthase-like glycosyltransferase
MINIIITSYKEPKTTVQAVNALLNQKNLYEDFKIIVVDPFPEVKKFLKKNIKDKRVEFFLDPGEGKNYALNILLDEFYSKDTNDILIFTDGDVYVSDTAVSEMIKKFKDKKVGAVTGKPVSIDSRKTKFGFWSKVVYGGIHKVRVQLDKQKKFFQCSGYLFAIRNGLLSGLPLDVPEDAIIPYFIHKKGFRVAYAENAEVYVKYPDNWDDWINQRVRTIKAHENISKTYKDMPRTKSFFNEIRAGILYAIRQPKNAREFLWSLQLYFARLYIYYKSFRDMQNKIHFNPAWREEEVQSTKTLDKL